jgi:hypothetical protein
MEVQNLPAYVADLQNVYGDNSQTIGNGSAVYFKVFTSEDIERMSDSLESATMGYLRQYAGRMWSREQDDGSMRPGEEIWQVSLFYQRPSHDMGIVDELKQLLDQRFTAIAPVLDFFQEDQLYSEVLHRAFDDPSVALLYCYEVNDSAAYNGLIIAACRTNGEAVFWFFTTD